jgi:hypothetical protein
MDESTSFETFAAGMVDLEEKARAATDEQIRAAGAAAAAGLSARLASESTPDDELVTFFRLTLADLLEIVDAGLKRGLPWEFLCGRMYQKAASTQALLAGLETAPDAPAPTE